MSDKAQVAVTGLAVMGRNLARNFARNGYGVAVHNRTARRTRDFMERFGGEGQFVPAESLAELVDALERPRRVVMMVQAGDPTDAVIGEIIPLLEPGDVLIDGGNAHFEDTERRARKAAEHEVHFVGTGISGGEEGALHGPSIMPGGTAEAYRSLGPMLETISAHVDGQPCCTHIGPGGAGHFVKMVHNGIEYADMQLIAESYDLLRHLTDYGPSGIAEVFRGFNRGRLSSYLVEITAEVLGHRDLTTGGPFVDVVRDSAEQKGTGRWTVRTALDLGVPVSGIAEAVFARSLSGHDDLREPSRVLRGPRPDVLSREEAEQLVADVEQALYASKVVSYAQGWNMIAAGGEQYGWNIDLGAVAAIWRGGCIIRAAFLDRIRSAYHGDPQLPTLLVDAEFARELAEAQNAWRRVVSTGARAGIPVPGISSALAYYDALRAERLPAALVQGLRDYFGAHTYRRTDSDGAFHTRWEESGRPEESADTR